MKRVGPWLFCAGLAMLGAGILSTRSESWKRPERAAQDIALDLSGVDTIELGSGRFEQVVIADHAPRIHIKWFGRVEARDEANPITALRTSNRLLLKFKAISMAPENVTVNIAPGIATLSGRNLNVEARSSAGKLRIEGFDLNWSGAAELLDLRGLTWPTEETDSCATAPSVHFTDGEVAQLRVSIERGHVNMGDLSRVVRIELHAGPEVSLRVARIEDLARIKLFPFDGEATPPPPEFGPDHPCARYRAAADAFD